MARLGPLLTPKFPPKKFMWVPFLRPFPGTEVHKLFSGGGQMGCFGWGQKVYVEKVYVLFRSPIIAEIIKVQSVILAMRTVNINFWRW